MLGSGVVEVGSDTSSSRMLVKALLASTELRDRKAVEGVRRVMRDHTYAGRVDDLLRTVGLDAGPRSRPLVSIVAPTHRLGGYESIIRNAGRQTYRDFELILGLHGVDEPESRIRDVARDQGLHNLTIVRLPSERSLGSVCNELIEAASGTHVARMDDDDFYGAHYLEDQMRAFEYTEADVVGKWTRFIYLVWTAPVWRDTPDAPGSVRRGQVRRPDERRGHRIPHRLRATGVRHVRDRSLQLRLRAPYRQVTAHLPAG
jgi:hypothetical protein